MPMLFVMFTSLMRMVTYTDLGFKMMLVKFLVLLLFAAHSFVDHSVNSFDFSAIEL